MIYKNKRDREAWIREKSINSMKENIYIDENDIIEVSSGNFYKAVKTTTDIPLKNNLFAQLVPSEVVGNITTATKLKTARNIALSGDVTGNANFDGSANISITATVGNDSHTHSNSTITSLDGSKIDTGTISADRLPVLPTNKIPNIDASKITSGTIDISRLPAAALERCVVVQNDTARFALTKAQVQVGDSVKVITPDDLMYVVVDDNKLNQEAGYVKYGAAVKWETIKDKPSTFPPSTHTHTKNQITDFPVALKNPTALSIQLNGGTANVYDGSAAKSINITPASIGAQVAGSYAAASHTHPATQVTQDATHRFVTDVEKNTWNGKAAGNHNHDSSYTKIGHGHAWGEISGKPGSFTPSGHNQASNTITAMTGYSKPTSTSAIVVGDTLNAAIGKLEKALDGKQPSGNYSTNGHTHDERYFTETEINNLLKGKANTSHGNHVPATQTASNKVFLRNDNTWATITPANIGAQPAGNYSVNGHTHDDRYYTESEINTKLNGKADAHSHPYLNLAGGTLTGALTVNSTIKATGTVTCSDCVTTSDERLKKDIVKIDNALEKVNQLSGYTFFKEGDKQRTTGVIAQELLNVLPEAVFEREDGYYSVSYGNIVGLLIEAIKELQGEVRRLKGDY